MTLTRMLERLEATDVAALDAGGVSAGLRDVARLKGFLATVEADLDPEAGVRVFSALDAELAALVTADRAVSPSLVPRSDTTTTPRRDQLAAQGLVELITSSHRSARPGRAEMLYLVDHATITPPSRHHHATMVDDLHEQSVCEYVDGTSLPVATARRLACDAQIYPIVLGGDGVVLDMGRARRLATPDQRRALRSMYRSCGVGDCETPFDHCEIHHLDDWAGHRGQTNLDRLIPACSRHHHLAHEGGWQLELDPVTRELTVRLPDGTIHSRNRPGPHAGRRQPSRSEAASTVGEVARPCTPSRTPGAGTVARRVE